VALLKIMGLISWFLRFLLFFGFQQFTKMAQERQKCGKQRGTEREKKRKRSIDYSGHQENTWKDIFNAQWIFSFFKCKYIRCSN